ncbi:beta-ketoacyl synthase N-terminal-like domain-containing protein [Streptomyces sp. NPDC018347]|uniref:beta-ketoacyl synthase N-terminal-like domain-containing protein n=1 Tax=Streptomyces sp. NPDC018347 TaxID=3157193 RepID=UPI0033C00A3D
MTSAREEQIIEALRRSVKENQRLRQEMQTLSARAHEPVAVVSMACRLPGGVRSPEDMWEVLIRGEETLSEFPEDRGWDLDALYDPTPGLPGRCYTRVGGFLDCAGDFDPAFFGITPREAMAMDPQQRLLMQTAWEAVERAGLPSERLRETATGVFVGALSPGYSPGTDRVPEQYAGYVMTGNETSVLSGRVAYHLGLNGPAITVDTACSSSLVALHLAVQSLRSGECDLALAGGVTVMSTPDTLVEFSIQRGLAPDGRCKPFSAAADGTVLGEGVGVLLLARLADARRLGLPVLAVVKGSALNQDGASNGLTAPNGTAQRSLIRSALDHAGLAPGDVDLVEAHGTGTTLGDPIEAEALLDVYGRNRPPDRPLYLGSLKSNFGHPQAAAGVAGVIKTVLALRAGRMPRTLHLDRPTPHVDWESAHVRLLDEERDWPAGDRPRRAAVSSFGISGTNAHVVLEEAPTPDGHPLDAAPAATDTAHQVFLLSGQSGAALRAQAARLDAHLAEHPEVPLAAVAGALATTRTAFGHRAALVARTTGEVSEALRALADGLPHNRSVTDEVRRGRTAFLFAGQGAHRAGMGAELHAAQPAFADALDEVSAAFDRHQPRPLREVMFGTGPGTAGLLERTLHAQPALFAFEVAMCRLLASWGLRPDLLLGHSIGELAAAYVAGVWSLEDAAALVSARGRLMDNLPAGGAMAALQASEAEVLAELERVGSAACVAAVNGPQAVVVSGPEADVLAAVARWKAAGRKATRLRVSHAFHSDLVTPVLEEFREVAESLTYRRPAVPVVSDVTGMLAPPDQLCSPAYWVRHVREAVRFADGVRTLRDHCVATLLDVGPNGSLAALATGCLADAVPDSASADRAADGEVVTIAASRQSGTEVETVLLAVGAAHARGAAVDRAALAGSASAPADLPTYAFQEARYWWPRPGGGPAPAVEPPTGPSADAAPYGAGEALGGERLASVVRAEVAAVTGLASPSDVDPQRSFLDIGLTSVGALELHRRLQKATGARISVTFAYEHPTPAALCAHLEAATATRTPPPPACPAAVSPAPVPSRSAGSERLPAAGGTTAGPVDDDAIVIVGMGCRYPGGVTGPDRLWELVRDEVDAVSGFPQDRGWPLAELYHPDPEHSGTSYTREGGFLDDVAGFDAPFFGVSPREAAAMDPQHRLLLETAWEAMERAGVDPLSVRDSAFGVFLGIAMQDYRPRADEGGAEEADQMAAYRITGLAPSVASGRIAYLLGARGPAMTVDTACSSSLVALHLAVRSLRTGESDMALAGGATVLASPDSFIGFSRQRGLSPDGRCKAFSADADGTGWAEGAGVLLLETLGRARRLGHPVLAVVRGTAINQDGASNGLTAPNGLAQQDVIRAALTDAGLAPGDVDLVEAHGTGTALGDPVEANALLAAYGTGRDPERPLRLGSLKSNIGHSMAAAGVGGVIKAVMAMRRERMPRTLHADQPTPHADWDSGAVRLLTEAVPWPRQDTPRRAAVSAFGMSGTNAHVVLEEAPRDPAASSAAAPADGRLVWLLSAPTRSALRAQARRHAEHARSHPEQDAKAIGRVLAGRSLFRHRAVVTGADRATLLDGLDALAAGRTSPAVVEGAAGAHRTVLVVPPGTDDDWADAWRSYGVEPHLVLRSDDPELSARLTAAVADGHGLVLQCAPGLGVLGRVQQVAAASGPKVTVVLCTGRPDPADDRFVRALAQAHTGGVPVDWTRLTGRGGGPLVTEVPTYAFQRTRHWAADVGPATPPAPAAVSGTTGGPARAAARVPDPVGWETDVPEEERHEALLSLVCGAVADLLGIDEADLDPEDGFFQQGLDSLMAVRLRQTLEREFDQTLPTTLLFEQPTAAALAAFLAEETAVTRADGVAAGSGAERLPAREAADDEDAGATEADPGEDGEADMLALLEAEIDRARTVREGITR